MTSAPFVNFKMIPTSDINSTPVPVFSSEQGTCLVDGILLVNPGETPLLVSLYLTRPLPASPQGSTPTGEPKEFSLSVDLPLRGYERLDLLKDLALTLEYGDTLYAYSDDASHLLNVFVSYRELHELTPSSTPGGSYA